jgi:hypothetical protein
MHKNVSKISVVNASTLEGSILFFTREECKVFFGKIAEFCLAFGKAKHQNAFPHLIRGAPDGGNMKN